MPIRRPPSHVATMFNGIKKGMPSPGAASSTPTGKGVPNLARNAAIAISETEKAQGMPRRRVPAKP